MKIPMIPTNELLDKLRSIHVDKLPCYPDHIQERLDRIQRKVGDRTYLSIEEDITEIFDFFENRGFNLGARLTVQILTDLATQDYTE